MGEVGGREDWEAKGLGESQGKHVDLFAPISELYHWQEGTKE